MKCLSLTVYRCSLGDCTNGGISAVENTVYIPCDEGPTDSDNIKPELLFNGEQRGPNYWAITPMMQPKGKLGPMHGGNLASTCDSRGKGMVYRIHDRFETQAEYDSMSR